MFLCLPVHEDINYRYMVIGCASQNSKFLHMYMIPLFQPTDVILPSGKQYLLHYDNFGNLKAVIMPNLARHRFHSLTTFGIHRKFYEPPEGHGSFLQDYDSSGNLLQVLHPSGHRRVTYRYTSLGQPRLVLYDWSDIKYQYYEETQMLRSMQLFNPVPFDYNCTLVYGPGNALVKSQQVLFTTSNVDLLHAHFQYEYDKNFRLAWIEANIGGHHLAGYNYTYDPDNGRLNKLKSFTIVYPRRHRDVVGDSNIEFIREYDGLGRMSDRWYRFNNYVVASLEIKFDNFNRVHQWRRKIGSSDLKAFEYVYDIDGNVVEVLVNGQRSWSYEIDRNSNIINIGHHRTTRTVDINSKNQVELSEDNSYIFDKDGFLVQRDSEVFEYNSKGQLLRAFENGKYDIYYFYDPHGRMVGRKDAMGGYLTQFFYADLRHLERLTHIYNHQSEELTSLYYDNNNQLFAMDRNGATYYIVLDPLGSPLLILDSVGSVTKQMAYDPLGAKVEDSSPDFDFVLGYRCGVVDHITKLVFLESRVYDPIIGRWTSPNYADLLERTEEIVERPELLNVYRYQSLVGAKPLQRSLKTGGYGLV